LPRPRGYARDAVLAAAKDVFWENGYEGTVLSELEERTGLNRSSLYLEFGSKQELFSAALDLYYGEVVDPLLSALESGRDLAAIETFLAAIQGIILDERDGRRRGCLLVNIIAELSPHDVGAARRAREFQDRLYGAFTSVLERNSSTADLDEALVRRRAGLLVTGTLGIWISARIDLDDAAARCDEVAAEVRSWSVRDAGLLGKTSGA
jgi:TetR/AcrR family transcriptional regulator, transcriptional repressor for nem operon